MDNKVLSREDYAVLFKIKECLTKHDLGEFPTLEKLDDLNEEYLQCCIGTDPDRWNDLKVNYSYIDELELGAQHPIKKMVRGKADNVKYMQSKIFTIMDHYNLLLFPNSSFFSGNNLGGVLQVISKTYGGLDNMASLTNLEKESSDQTNKNLLLVPKSATLIRLKSYMNQHQYYETLPTFGKLVQQGFSELAVRTQEIFENFANARAALDLPKFEDKHRNDPFYLLKKA